MKNFKSKALRAAPSVRGRKGVVLHHQRSCGAKNKLNTDRIPAICLRGLGH